MSVRRARLWGPVLRGLVAGALHTAAWALGCHFFSHKFDNDLLPVLPLAAADCLLSYWILRRRGNPSFAGWLLSLPIWGVGMLRLLISPETWRTYFFAWRPYSDLLGYYYNRAMEAVTPLFLLGSTVTLWLLLREGEGLRPVPPPPRQGRRQRLGISLTLALLTAGISTLSLPFPSFDPFSPFHTLCRLGLAVAFCVLTRRQCWAGAVWVLILSSLLSLGLTACIPPLKPPLSVYPVSVWDFRTSAVWDVLSSRWHCLIFMTALHEWRLGYED